MPWGPGDAKRHTKKASTGRKREVWSSIANRLLQGGAGEGSAIRQANSAVARIGKRTRRPRRPGLRRRGMGSRYKGMGGRY